MTDELAKQLYDAGFPHKFYWCCDFEKAGHECRADRPDCILTPQSMPTLSKLLETCGDRFGYLSRKEYVDGKYWVTNSDGSQEDITGKTPEEAVAKLWLALNA